MGVGEADQETTEQDESPFEGDEYDGEEDPEMGETEDEAEIEEDLGFSVTAMFIEDDEMAAEEEDQIHLAAISAAGGDAEIADEIVKTIKEQYEERGSGQKPRHRGKTAKQLKEDMKQNWTSNANVNPTGNEKKAQPRERGECLTTIIKVNGVDAFTCFDTGSQLDAISPDFMRATNMVPRASHTPVKVRLGTKGSSAKSSYEVDAKLGFDRNTEIEHTLDVLNIDRWDVIIGTTFLRKKKAIINFENNTVTFGKTIIKGLTSDKEAAVNSNKKRNQTVHLGTLTA